MTRTGKVTVVGAGFYGSTTAQRLAEYDIFDEVVLTDIVEGKPEGLALDMNQSRPVEGFETKVTGQTTGRRRGLRGDRRVDIVIVTAGLPRKPGMSRMDLIETNAKIVRSVTEQVVKHAPDTVLIVVSNPLDEMTALAAKVSGSPRTGHGPGGHAGHRPVHLLRGRAPRRAGRVGAHAHPGLARGHDGAGPLGVHGGRQAAGRPDVRRGHRGPGAAHPRRRGRDRRPAEDRVGLLRAVGRRGPDGAGRGRGRRRCAAGLRLGRRPVRHLRRLPGRRGRDRPDRLRRVVERDLTGDELDSLRAAAQAVRAKQADVASL